MRIGTFDVDHQELLGTSYTALDWIVVGVGLNLAHASTDTPYPTTGQRAHGAAMTPEGRCLRSSRGWNTGCHAGRTRTTAPRVRHG
jgi:hypothetical protein